MPMQFPFANYGKALINISQPIFTRQGNNCTSTRASVCTGVKCVGSWLRGRGTLRLLHLPGEQRWCPAPLLLQHHTKV